MRSISIIATIASALLFVSPTIAMTDSSTATDVSSTVAKTDSSTTTDVSSIIAKTDSSTTTDVSSIVAKTDSSTTTDVSTTFIITPIPLTTSSTKSLDPVLTESHLTETPTPTDYQTLTVSPTPTPPATLKVRGIKDSMNNTRNFIVPHGYGPERWGCSFTKTQVRQSDNGTDITIGTDSELKPFSCGEMIHKQGNLTYGTFSIEIIASNVTGQVTSFFLIANGDTEIDVELTGLNSTVGWMNVWHDGKQNPKSLDLPFDTSKDWHKYTIDWFKDHIAWYIDDKLVLNRSDIPTTSPDLVNYKLVINSWTQSQPEVNIAWAGIFQYPNDGRVPRSQFRNMEYLPRVYDINDVPQSVDNGIYEEPVKPHKNATTSTNSRHLPKATKAPTSAKPSSGSLVNTQTILVNGGTAIIAVLLGFTNFF